MVSSMFASYFETPSAGVAGIWTCNLTYRSLAAYQKELRKTQGLQLLLTTNCQ